MYPNVWKNKYTMFGYIIASYKFESTIILTLSGVCTLVLIRIDVPDLGVDAADDVSWLSPSDTPFGKFLPFLLKNKI